MTKVIETDFVIPTKDALTSEQYNNRIGKAFSPKVALMFPSLLWNSIVVSDEAGPGFTKDFPPFPEFIRNYTINQYSFTDKISGAWWTTVGGVQFALISVYLDAYGYSLIQPVFEMSRFGGTVGKPVAGLPSDTGLIIDSGGTDAAKTFKFLTVDTGKDVVLSGRGLSAFKISNTDQKVIAYSLNLTSTEVADTDVSIIKVGNSTTIFKPDNTSIVIAANNMLFNKMYNNVIVESLSGYSEQIRNFDPAFTVNKWNSKIPLHRVWIGEVTTGMRGYLTNFFLLPRNYVVATSNAEPWYEFITIAGESWLLLNVDRFNLVGVDIAESYLVVKV